MTFRAFRAEETVGSQTFTEASFNFCESSHHLLQILTAFTVFNDTLTMLRSYHWPRHLLLRLPLRYWDDQSWLK